MPWVRGKRLDRFEFRQFPHKEQAMNFVGIDLHKKSISVCVVDQERQVLIRKRFACAAPDRIVRRRLRWARSTEADGERECAETSPPLFLHRRLDKGCFIEGLSHPERRNAIRWGMSEVRCRRCSRSASHPRSAIAHPKVTAPNRESRRAGTWSRVTRDCYSVTPGRPAPGRQGSAIVF